MAGPSGFHRPVGPMLAGRYQMREMIRSGRAFSMYAAYDLLGKEHVLMWVSSHSLRRDFPQTVACVREQAERNAHNRHALFLNVLFVGEESDRLFFIEERPKGASMQAALHKRRAQQEVFSSREAFGMGCLLCQALDRLHGHSVHGFLNPEDVYLEHWPGGPIPFYPRIARTGLRAALRSASMAFDGLSEEAACYAAPEFSGDTQLQTEVDLYGMGALLYTFFTLRPPTGCFVRPSRVGSGLPAELDDLLLKALEDDPAERFGQVRAFLQALIGLQGETLSMEEFERAQDRLFQNERMHSQAGHANPREAAESSPSSHAAGPPSHAVPMRGWLKRRLSLFPLLSRILLLALSLTLLVVAIRDAPSRLRRGRSGPEDVQRWDRLFHAQEVSEVGVEQRAESSETETDRVPPTKAREDF